jgi:hypothetical protein
VWFVPYDLMTSLSACLRVRPHRPRADGERDLWLERNLSPLSPDPFGLVPMVNQMLGYALGDDLAHTSDPPTDARSVRFGGAVDRASFCGRGGSRAAGPRRGGTNVKICPGRPGGTWKGVRTRCLGLSPLGHYHGATSGLSLASESSGVRRLHIGYCRRRPWGVRRSSEARQASGTFLGREPRVAAGAATRGYGRVPLQGTCAAGVVRAEGVSVCN